MLYTFQQSFFLFDWELHQDAGWQRSYLLRNSPFHLVPDGVNALGASVDPQTKTSFSSLSFSSGAYKIVDVFIPFPFGIA